MLFKLYKGNSPYVIILIIFTGIVFWIPGFIRFAEPGLPFDFLRMPLYNYVYNLLGISATSNIVAFTLIIISGFYLNRLNSEFGFLKEHTQIPALFFIIINSSFPFLLRLTPPMFAGIFLLFAIDTILKSYRKENLSYNFFEASFILSLASFFYLPLLFLWPLIFAGLIILRPVIWREWALSFFGLLLPYYLFIGAEFFRLGELESSLNLLIGQFSIININDLLNIQNKAFVFGAIFLTMLATLLVLKTLANRKIFQRKTLLFLFWIFVFSIIIFLQIDNAHYEAILFSSIPVSFFLSEFFLSIRSYRWKEILFILFILLGLVSVYSSIFVNKAF